MKRKDELDELLQEINEYKSRGKLAFFVGAGVSKMSDYPSWYELVMSMAKEIGYNFYQTDKEKVKLSSEEFLKIPQMYFNKMGESAYLDKVKRELNVRKKPNNIHKLIMRMNPYHVLTTNYDDLLEQTANIFSINYSVINSDTKVSEASTQRYILKVHGDFEQDNFVLKESDYLNYEQNFKLIDNLMKTIMATNMIVFIGYQLNDYNIKLILNWVQNVQGSSFIEPVFIYTDPNPLDDISIDYYKNRRLRIICAYDLCPSGTYNDRYKAVLDKMIFYKDEPKNNTNEALINYIYNKLQLLDEIKYLRAEDFIKLFENQSIDKDNIINAYDKDSIFSRYYKIYDEKEELESEQREKVEYIMQRIRTSGIVGCHTKDKTYVDMEYFKITNEAFLGDYQSIEENIVAYGDNIEDLYNKAYNLCMLGKLEEAYHLYIYLLDRCKEEKHWFYYFFSQINLKLLSQIIRYIEHITKSFQGILYFGEQLDLFEAELLEDIGLIQTYTDLPADIKKYSFLNKLSSKNYYSDDIVKLYERNYTIQSEISDTTVALIGSASYDKSEILMNDAINFIYNNRIIFSMFSEHNKFIRTTMHTYLLGKAERMKIEPNDEYYIRKEEFQLDNQDILLLIKNFKLNELKFLTKQINLFDFIVSQQERKKFEKYIEYTIDYYKSNFVPDIIRDKIKMYILVKEQIKSMCYLGAFFIKNKNVMEKYINFFMEIMPERELDYIARLEILELIKSKYENNVDEVIIQEIDNFLVRKIQFCLDNSRADLLKHWSKVVQVYPIWLNQKYPNFRSERLLQIYINSNSTEENKKFLDNLLPIIEMDEIKDKIEIRQ